MPRKRTRRKVDSLPPNAIKVADYAKKVGLSVGRIYQKESEKKADFEMVMFHGANFVIPKLSEEEFGKELIAREHEAAGIAPPEPIAAISNQILQPVAEALARNIDEEMSVKEVQGNLEWEDTQKTNVVFKESKNGNISMWHAPNPKNLEELKELCPAELKGLDRSAWISEHRQKYGI